MKFLIASDLHGSVWAARQVRDIFKREQPERLILLGDLLYHGPRNPLPRDYDPQGVAAVLNGLKDRIMAVRGNCESEVDQMVLEFPVGADYMIWYDLGTLIFTTHGHLFNSDRRPPVGRRDILLHGHTHVPAVTDLGDFVYLNPGSAALPKEGFDPSVMLYEDGAFTIRALDGRELMRYDMREGYTDG